MRNVIRIGIGAAVVGAAVAMVAASPARAAGCCGGSGGGSMEVHGRPEAEHDRCEDGGCPMEAEGAAVSVRDIPGGVRIEITSVDTATVRSIRGKARACAAHAEARTPPAAAYACPMHSEVTSDAPGRCSKCGMDLVRRTTARTSEGSTGRSAPAGHSGGGHMH